MWQTEVPGGNTPFWPVRLVYELKNERGQGGDPETQAIAQYIKLLADEKWTRLAEASNCPAILFTIAGTHLAISTAILTDTVYVEDLYSINLHACFNLEARLLNLARALHAVKCAFEEPGVISQDGSHLLPKPVGLDGAYLLGLRFFRKLPHRGLGAPDTTDTRSQDRAYALYLAIGDGTHIPSKEVVVKFPRYRYNPTAHALLAAQNLAPKLYSHNPVLGAHSMVVMDVVEGITAWEWVHSGRKLPRSVYADIERAVVLLREHNLVFGDLRLPNIMVRPDGSGALVDFDWADEDERGRYPALLAEDPDEWAPGVQKYGLMLKHHDRHMLEKLKEYCERPV
ncbi:hypothetical protein OE88DRAFT_1669092 [Heliocybe sulcata]|uniref:Protein kinase domain-containing protein n=1 Tax=Heliocybe sulcata TaxID=5364 RepID=A0A5C3ML28_9AGAM|nr:hypothetical protein OE88DRAFT_1669092 [Heliocybe sulcata]